MNKSGINPLNAELNPIRHLLALVGAHHIVHVSRVRVSEVTQYLALSSFFFQPAVDLLSPQNTRRN